MDRFVNFCLPRTHWTPALFSLPLNRRRSKRLEVHVAGVAQVLVAKAARREQAVQSGSARPEVDVTRDDAVAFAFAAPERTIVTRALAEGREKLPGREL
jgi:hypothetical protein